MAIQGKYYMRKTDIIMQIIKDQLKNNELRDYILDNLCNFIYNKNAIYVGQNGNELNIRLKKSTDTFLLGFYPDIYNFDTIEIECSHWDRKLIEKKVIHYEDNVISIEELVLDKCVSCDNNELAEISQKRKIRKYQDDILIYQYDYSSSICNKIDSRRNSTSESETYISGCQAVKKENIVKQADAFGLNNGTIYSATNYFDVPYFDSTKNNKRVYVYAMHGISENEYNQFLQNLKLNGKQLTKV